MILRIEPTHLIVAGRIEPGSLTDLVYLSRQEVADLLPAVLEQIDICERTYRAMAAGRVELPPKPGIHPREEAFIHAMPAYLADTDVASIKWVAGYPANKARGLPYISGLIIVNDAETGFPAAVHRRCRDHRRENRGCERRMHPAVGARRAGAGRPSWDAASRAGITRASWRR